MLTTKERMEMESYRAEPEVSGWAVGGVVFAAVLMILIGVFQAFAGLAASWRTRCGSWARTTSTTST